MFILLPKFRTRISFFAIPTLILMLKCEGAFAFSLVLLSAAIHELGHITAMLLQGIKPRRVDILPMGALIVCPEGVPFKSQLIISICGPLASLFSATVAAVIYIFAPSAGVLFFGVINLTLCLFNLLPARKNDGGVALFCLITLKTKKEKTARRICLAVSVISKIFFAALSFMCLAYSGYNLGMGLLLFALIVQL